MKSENSLILLAEGIVVRGNSSHLQRLNLLNIELAKQGLKPITIKIASPHPRGRGYAGTGQRTR